jgi:predicted dehydrogenase
MGEHRPVQDVAGIPWANAHAATATARLPGGGFWHCSWLLLDGILNFRERLSLYFVDGVHELEFPAPYAVEAPIRHSVIDSVSGHHRARAQCLANSAFVAELEHFHDCVVGGVPCRTPVGQAIKDLTLLRDLFVSQPVHTMS